MATMRDNWRFAAGQKKHTQDGPQLVSLIKGIGRGLKPVLAIDVGCGDGIIARELLLHRKATWVIAIDVLSAASDAAKHNLRYELENKRAEVRLAPAETLFRDKSYWDRFDRFVINPPFFSSGSGRANASESDQVARHEGRLGVGVWARGARRLLKTGGDLYCVFPTERMAELLGVLSRNQVEPKEIWWFRDDLRKRRFFLRATKGAKPGLKIHFEF